MIDSPPGRSAPSTEVVSKLIELGRAYIGCMDAASQKEWEEWLHHVEARTDVGVRARERESVVEPREKGEAHVGVLDRCGRCGRPGHKRTTCSEPDPIAKLLAATAPKHPPTILVDGRNLRDLATAWLKGEAASYEMDALAAFVLQAESK